MSVCQVARRWVDMGSFYTRLFGMRGNVWRHRPPNFGQNRPGCFTMTTPRLTLPSSPTSFWWKQNCCYPPPTVLPWFGTLWLLPISKTEIEAERTPVWYHWGDPGRIAESAWPSDRKRLPGSVPKMEETVGPVFTCGKELLWEWWRPIGLMESFIIFTASVRKIWINPCSWIKSNESIVWWKR